MLSGRNPREQQIFQFSFQETYKIQLPRDVY